MPDLDPESSAGVSSPFDFPHTEIMPSTLEPLPPALYSVNAASKSGSAPASLPPHPRPSTLRGNLRPRQPQTTISFSKAN